ncbi:MAG: extracellular solute-binding protein [Actinobacteria bacterium]|nr:extracellular solute-binding protein [Actinomycetota bacterium]
MKTKRIASFGALRLGVISTLALALVITPLGVGMAASTPSFGKSCPTEGTSTGTSSKSLQCTKNSSGKLTWVYVRLGSSTLSPVPALSAPDGTIEFWHWRAEDKIVLQSIIDKFEAANPGTYINQVIMPSGDYTNTAYAKIRTNPKAAIFATFRGSQFAQFAKGDMMTDLNSQRYTKRNVVANGLVAGQYGGKQLGIPYQYLFNNPVYNTAIFAKEKWALPTNLTTLLSWCKTAKAAGYTPLAWSGGFRPNAGQILNSMLMNSAPDYATLQNRIEAIDTGSADLTSPWFTDMANKYKKMADAGCFPENATGVTDAAALNLFATGKAAVLPTGSFSMGAVKAINPDMSGKMNLFSLITTDDKPQYVGIHNNTFILSVNKNATRTNQKIANAFISYLVTGSIAGIYANATSQHVNVLDVNYTNVDLLNTSAWQAKKTLLAPRFLWLNQGVRDLVEDALIAIVGGKPVDATLADFSKQIKQKLSA